MVIVGVVGMPMAMPPVVIVNIIPIVVVVVPELIADIFAMILPIIPTILPIGGELIRPFRAAFLATLHSFPIGSGAFAVRRPVADSIRWELGNPGARGRA